MVPEVNEKSGDSVDCGGAGDGDDGLFGRTLFCVRNGDLVEGTKSLRRLSEGGEGGGTEQEQGK